MKDKTVKDIALLKQMRERICSGCTAFQCYCRHCAITEFAKGIQKDLDKDKR
ncbi:hypothetical protein UT300012_33010 [Paraclostridium bifermentans]